LAAGDFIMIRRISLCVHDRNTAIDDGADAIVVGLGAWAVAAMTSSTLRLKNAAKPSAVWPVAPVTLRSRPSIEDSDRHSIGDIGGVHRRDMDILFAIYWCN